MTGRTRKDRPMFDSVGDPVRAKAKQKGLCEEE
jgi:hypothetical protein